MNKKIGDDIDNDLLQELILDLNELLQKYSAFLESSEAYHKNLLAKSLLENVEKELLNNSEQLTVIAKNMLPNLMLMINIEKKLLR